jgi:predicted CXXCH cytochrome family protein
MDCADCHQAAHKSTLTADILMPPQKLCAECHRPLPAGSRVVVAKTINSPAPSMTGGDLAAEQRRTGGIKWDCQSCHVFHAPPDASEFAGAVPSRTESDRKH